jgi:hypothetical protein
LAEAEKAAARLDRQRLFEEHVNGFSSCARRL